MTLRAAQTITFNKPDSQNFGTNPTLTATSSSGLNVTFTSETPEVCTVTSGGVLTFIKAGTATITANQAGDALFLPATSVSRSFTVNPVAPGAPTGITAIEGDTQARVSFTAPAYTGGAAITGYTITVSPADVAPVNGAASPIVVTGLTNGVAYTFTVTATNSVGPGTASAASNSVTPRAAQTITFNNPGAQNFGTSPTLTASSDSGLTVTFTSETPEVCTVTSGGVLTFISAGTATITANQAGDGSYLPAPSVSRTFAVNPIAPGAPTGVTATAGSEQASVSFTAPVSDGGASIIGYTVTSSPGGHTATGAGSPIKVTGLTNGVTYTFTVTATNDAGTGTASTASSSVMPQAPVYDDSPSTPTTPPSNNAVVEVNGERQDAGTSATTTTDGQTVTTITVDGAKLDKILESSGENPTVTLPSTGSAVIVGELNGQTVKNMENKEATLEIKTDTVIYTLPASQLNIDAVSALLGSQVELKDIKVSVKIAEPAADTVRIVEDTANRGGYQLVVKPVEFEITCTNRDQTVEVSRFNGYVERTIAIPEGIDPSKITTGIVLNADGTFSHVPTQIIVINGKYYAKINSLTNSVYSVVYNPVTFTDALGHWAEAAINDMGSRMIVNSMDSGAYEPDRNVTRAEFAAIVVKALGLVKGTTESPFDDVTLTDWFNGYVYTATAYNLITGYDNESFAPNDIITREQAMTILARAMKLTGISVTLTESEVAELFANYTDAGLVSDYARAGVAACIKTAVVSGTTASTLSPKDSVTRAEVATMIQRLLLNSGLI
ncbi:MAG: S-layer homology domain-containing protein [Eubacteriales bacterium]